MRRLVGSKYVLAMVLAWLECDLIKLNSTASRVGDPLGMEQGIYRNANDSSKYYLNQYNYQLCWMDAIFMCPFLDMKIYFAKGCTLLEFA